MMRKLEQHHVKYKELHGADKIVMLTHSEHRALHHRLRREGKCNVPVDELAKISDTARRRSPGGKAYGRSATRKAGYKKYMQTEKGKTTAKKHEARRQSIRFDESFGEYTLFRERIRYNHATGFVGYTARFNARQGHVLPVIDIGGEQ